MAPCLLPAGPPVAPHALLQGWMVCPQNMVEVMVCCFPHQPGCERPPRLPLPPPMSLRSLILGKAGCHLRDTQTTLWRGPSSKESGASVQRLLGNEAHHKPRKWAWKQFLQASGNSHADWQVTATLSTWARTTLSVSPDPQKRYELMNVYYSKWPSLGVIHYGSVDNPCNIFTKWFVFHSLWISTILQTIFLISEDQLLESSLTKTYLFKKPLFSVI